MSLLVVGSVAFDALETPHGKVERTLGGAASYFALAASYFAPVRVVAIVGDDFSAKDKAVFHGRRDDIFLVGPVQQEHERAHDAGNGVERIREFSAHSAGCLLRFVVYFPGEHRSNAAAVGAETDEVQAESGGARHHELLDRADTSRIARDAEAHTDPND